MREFTAEQLAALHGRLTAARNAIDGHDRPEGIEPYGHKDLHLYVAWGVECCGNPNTDEDGYPQCCCCPSQTEIVVGNERNVFLFAAAADPRTGLLASIDRDLAHVQDHMHMVEAIANRCGSASSEDFREALALHTARLWAHYMEAEYDHE